LGVTTFINEVKRILRLAKKPSKRELWLSIRISSLGIIAIGIIGYIITLIAQMISSTLTGAGA